MYYSNMPLEHEFKQKSLKLLADPCKLRDMQYHPRHADPCRKGIEYKFDSELSDILYTQITQDIKELLTIDSVLQGVIIQVILDQSP
jgi:hypothetical protein